LVYFHSNSFGRDKKIKYEIGDISLYLPDPLVDDKSYNKKMS
jgi:hypothetical protein